MKVKIMAKNDYKVIDLNRRKAIHERCLNCSCWNPREVTNCSFKDCPLYTFRTGKGTQNPKQRKNSIRKFCLWCMAGQQSEVRKCTSIHCPLFAYRMKRLDNSQKIVSLPKKDHIEPVFEEKTIQGGIVI